MSSSSDKKVIKIEYQENDYEIPYVRITDNHKTQFYVSIKDEALANLMGNEFSYRLSFKDNLEELDYPPTRGEQDLLLKKLILTKIFQQEGIEAIV